MLLVLVDDSPSPAFKWIGIPDSIGGGIENGLSRFKSVASEVLVKRMMVNVFCIISDHNLLTSSDPVGASVGTTSVSLTEFARPSIIGSTRTEKRCW